MLEKIVDMYIVRAQHKVIVYIVISIEDAFSLTLINVKNTDCCVFTEEFVKEYFVCLFDHFIEPFQGFKWTI